jgi:hypothetical protein
MLARAKVERGKWKGTREVERDGKEAVRKVEEKGTLRVGHEQLDEGGVSKVTQGQHHLSGLGLLVTMRVWIFLGQGSQHYASPILNKGVICDIRWKGRVIATGDRKTCDPHITTHANRVNRSLMHKKKVAIPQMAFIQPFQLGRTHCSSALMQCFY